MNNIASMSATGVGPATVVHPHGEDAVSPEPSAIPPAEKDFDWLSTLSPRQRSCINLGKVEPCVNKALQLLNRLKERLSLQQSVGEGHRHDDGGDHERSTKGGRVSTVMWEDDEGVKRGRGGGFGRVKTSASINESLCIEGTGMNTYKSSAPVEEEEEEEEEEGEGEGEEGWWVVIEGALNLVVRMEQDRQETLRKLSEEEERVGQLGLKLDKEGKRRLDLLETTVQAEHDSSVHDLQELRRSVEQESKHVARAQQSLDKVAAKNAKLTKNVNELLENSPLLDGKIAAEKEKIEEIAKQQQKTTEAVKAAQKVQEEAEERLLVARGKAKAEARERESKLKTARYKANRATEELSEVNSEVESLAEKIQEAKQTISESKQKALKYEEEGKRKSQELKGIKSQVDVLKKEHGSLASKNKKIEDHNTALQAQIDEERCVLEAAHAEQQSAVKAAVSALQDAKDRREQTEQENDEMREEIAACKKQQRGDQKTVERVRRDLVRLDQQMKVSKEQYSSARDRNHELTQRFTEEKARGGDKEYSMKTNIEDLQREIREENSFRTDLESKAKKGEVRLQRLTEELEEKKAELATATAEKEPLDQQYDKEVSALESELKEVKEEEERLASELAAVNEKHRAVETELGGKVAELKEANEEYKVELSERSEEHEEVSGRVKLLEERLEEVEKGIASTEKIQSDTQKEIYKLELEVEDLEEKVEREKEDGESWKQELQEITDFKALSETKFKTYLEERDQHLKSIRRDLHTSLSSNATLAEQYSRLQGDYLAEKTRMLELLERQELMKTDIRDSKQLQALQTQVSSTMKRYFEYRSATFSHTLASCQTQSADNCEELRVLQAELQTTLRTMDDFLEQEFHMKRKAVSFKE